MFAKAFYRITRENRDSYDVLRSSSEVNIPFISRTGEDGDSTHVCRTTSYSKNNMFLLILAIICTMINLIMVSKYSGVVRTPFPSPYSTPPFTGISQKDIDNLRRPSQFIGLDALHRMVPPQPKSFVNFPRMVSYLDLTRPGVISPADPNRYHSVMGTISPDTRTLAVSETVCLSFP